MVAGGGAFGPARRADGASRACAIGSLLLLALFAGLSARSRATGGPVDAFPLGAGTSQAGLFLALTSLLLGLALGWGVPGLSLAYLTDRSLRGPALLARSLGLGVGYILLTGLGHAIVAGHAPGRGMLVGLLAVPPLVLLGKVLRPVMRPANGSQRDPILAMSLLAMVALTGLPKLAREGLNGDGTEAYEIARSLEAHPVPRWDLERWEGTGRFGTPAVNPFLTNAYLTWAGMAVMGRGELAARLPFVPALVIAVVLAGGLASRPGRSGWIYLSAVGALYLLWNAYYVGYEPPFTDLAEPAATDTLMVALWLAGFTEMAAGAEWLGASWLVLAAGVLYSAPVLTVPALAGLGAQSRRWRPLLIWCAAAALAAVIALGYGAASGDLQDWVRQVRSEYWYDLVDQSRRSSTGRFAGQLLLLTGGLPLLAAFRWRRLSAASRALLCAAVLYLAIAFLSSYKNLHYLAPLPFLLAPAALEASGPRWRAAATAVVAAAFLLSWPNATAIHRETVDLGRQSCVTDMGYEEASLGADVVYAAFAHTGQAERFAVGKHTFVRYALELGKEPCLFRLSPARGDRWIVVAGDAVTFGIRDPDAYARWRLLQPEVPSSWLFPRPAPAPLPVRSDAWPAVIALGKPPGSALVIEDFDPREAARARARLLVPLHPGDSSVARIRVRVPHPAVQVEVLLNGRPAAPMAVPSDAAALDLSAVNGWRTGWNILELNSRPSGVVLESFESGPGSP